MPTIAVLVAQWHRCRSRGHRATRFDKSGRREVRLRDFPPDGWLLLLPLSAIQFALGAALTLHDTFSSHVRSVRTSSTHHIHHGGTPGRFMAAFRRHRLSAPPPRVTRLSGGPRWCPVARICAIREPNRPGSRSWVLWRPLICIVPVRRPQLADRHFGHLARVTELLLRGSFNCPMPWCSMMVQIVHSWHQAVKSTTQAYRTRGERQTDRS